MNLEGIYNVFLVIVVVAIGWTIVRTVFKLTMRLFTMGCFGIVILVGIGWILGWVG